MTCPISTSDWRRVRKQIDARIEELRATLERNTNTETDTATIRGRIAELRHLITWGEPPADEQITPLSQPVAY